MENHMRKQEAFGIRRLTTMEKFLVLTFDDGPDTMFTPAILKILDQYGVPATFFCIGSQILKCPDVVRSMVSAGHIVANHTWSHPFLTKESPESIYAQVEQTSNIIEETVGLRPRLFRPPYGDINAEVSEQLHVLGYDVILWDVDSVDWSGIPGPKVASNVLPHLRSGSILLHHSAGNVAGTVDALPYVIEVAAAMGYRFAAFDAVTGASAYCL